MSIASQFIVAKNKLTDKNAWLILCEVEYTTGQFQRFACNSVDDITWKGSTWVGLPVEIGSINENKGEIPQIQIRICNINRLVQAQVEQYNGAIDRPITLYVVHTGNLAVTTDVPTYTFYITTSVHDANWSSFTIGLLPSPNRLIDPKEKILKNFCRFSFPYSADPRCPYTGIVYTTCQRTLAQCIQRNGDDARKFGGFPTIGLNRIYV